VSEPTWNERILLEMLADYSALTSHIQKSGHPIKRTALRVVPAIALFFWNKEYLRIQQFLQATEGEGYIYVPAFQTGLNQALHELTDLPLVIVPSTYFDSFDFVVTGHPARLPFARGCCDFTKGTSVVRDCF
jgi:hypothetical protein